MKRSYKAPKWGQHFLIDEQIVHRIVRYAHVRAHDTILEIGGGTGNLTRALAKACEKLIVIEKDKRLVEQLSEIEHIEIIEGDALTVPFPSFDKTVSNLPYEISSEVTFKLLARPFTCGVLMYQKEFAERMVAEPGTREYSRLTVCLSYKSQCELLEDVPRTAFLPQPQVNSAIVRILPTPPQFEVYDEAFFHQFVRALFTQRRKTLRNALITTAKLLGADKLNETIDELPQHWLARRPYELAPPELGCLANYVFTRRHTT
ncbi:MAG: 16S rRNA (adenine(1518)-N(6)/adenine(1519)-N(6))-dimethyltransferase RsmA [Euryarchaeota archaeon]|nr:16S rRNA (adenine(1518)-N(6)/adenine(1519)-N(6))-dimethyltransferase RsmA [Euryarchaeota archaeon]